MSPRSILELLKFMILGTISYITGTHLRTVEINSFRLDKGDIDGNFALSWNGSLDCLDD